MLKRLLPLISIIVITNLYSNSSAAQSNIWNSSGATLDNDLTTNSGLGDPSLSTIRTSLDPQRISARDSLLMVLAVNAQDSAMNSTLMDDQAMGVIAPPDDPIDVPIDGGVSILLMIAVGSGYKKSRRKAKQVAI